MNTTLNQRKLSPKNKWGYAIGEFGEATGYNLFYFFFLFFLTDVAGLPPAVAGTISSIAIFWDAITDLVIGHWSDNFNSKFGRRRPFMIAVAIPYAICTYLMFCNFDMALNVKIAYAIILSMIFWTCYTIFVIPYMALGAEMTQDSDERTSLRTYAAIFIHVGTMVAASTPPLIVEKSVQLGMTEEKGWANVGLIIGIVILLGIVICWYLTKGTELPVEKTEVKKEEKVNIVKTIIEILKLKPSVPLAIAVFCGAFVCTMVSSGQVYVMTNNLGFNAGLQSIMLIVVPAMAIAVLPIIRAISSWRDNRTSFMLCMFIGGIGLAAFWIIGIHGVVSYIIWGFFFQMANSSLWALYYAMMYDISELDEFKNDKRREGIITAVMAFFQKIGGSIATWATGMILAAGAYDGTAAVQADSALDAIFNICTVIPGAICVIGGIALIVYPITGGRHAALREALEAKREGKEYSIEGFEKML